MKGFMIAAPASGSGKTTVTLGLLRALKRRGEVLAPVKAGPDYIDPAYHRAASGVDCFNLDPWAMRPGLISALSSRMTESGARVLVAEGMMGLFDGAIDGKGSSADLARLLDLPVVLVVDCARQSHSIAALVWGFSQFRKDVLIEGVILNRVGSPRHEAMLRGALAPLGVPVLGALPRDPALSLPERHLGLVQADEHAGLESFLEQAADVMEAHIDMDALQTIWLRPKRYDAMANVARLKPLETALPWRGTMPLLLPICIFLKAGAGGVRKSLSFPRWQMKHRRQMRMQSIFPVVIQNFMRNDWPVHPVSARR